MVLLHLGRREKVMKKTKKTKETNIPVSKTNRTWAFLGGGGGGEAKF